MPSDCNRVRVERYFLEEATAGERGETARHLESCPECRRHLDSLAHERRAYLTARPFSRFAAEHLETKKRSGWLAMPRAAPVLAGALATLVLVAVVQLPRKNGPSGGSSGVPTDGSFAELPGNTDNGIRAKGGSTFNFHFRRDGKVLPGSLDSVYRSGDELQFVYSSGTHAHVTLASVDAEGTVSLYRREADPKVASLPAEQGGLVSFPFSVTLDDARGGELFVLLLSSVSLPAEAVESWLSAAYDGAGGDLVHLEATLKPPASAGEVKTLRLKKASA
ncbi:MAG TPA: hypothetical protein VK465_12520 [Fibrobacteria bacterium]|nr:hypothetical protein [Fibrobacteria bacterium]